MPTSGGHKPCKTFHLKNGLVQGTEQRPSTLFSIGFIQLLSWLWEMAQVGCRGTACANQTVLYGLTVSYTEQNLGRKRLNQLYTNRLYFGQEAAANGTASFADVRAGIAGGQRRSVQVRFPPLPVLRIQGGEAQVHCISGPCHPPQLAG